MVTSLRMGSSTGAVAASPFDVTIRSSRRFSSLCAFQIASRGGELAIQSGQCEGRPPLVVGTGFFSCLAKVSAPS